MIDLLVGAGERAVEELRQGLVREAEPGLLLLARVDRVVEDALLGGRVAVARCVADEHDVLVVGVLPLGGVLHMLGFGAHLLAGDDPHVLGEAVLVPLADERLDRRGGDGHAVHVGLHRLERVAHPDEGAAVVHHVGDGGVDAVAPPDRLLDLLGRVLLGECGDSRVGQRVGGVEERLQLSPGWHLEAALGDLGAVAQQVQDLLEGDPPVQPAGRGVQVHEDGRLPGKRRDGLQVPVLDVAGGEALQVLDVHGVERATVGVDAHEEVVVRHEIDQGLGCRRVLGIRRSCAHDNSSIGDGLFPASTTGLFRVHGLCGRRGNQLPSVAAGTVEVSRGLGIAEVDRVSAVVT